MEPESVSCREPKRESRALEAETTDVGHPWGTVYSWRAGTDLSGERETRSTHAERSTKSGPEREKDEEHGCLLAPHFP